MLATSDCILDGTIALSTMFGRKSGYRISIDTQNWLGLGEHPHSMKTNSIEGNAVALDRPSRRKVETVSVHGGDGAATFADNVSTGLGLNAHACHHAPENFCSTYTFGIDVWKRGGQDGASNVVRMQRTWYCSSAAICVISSRHPPAPMSLRHIGHPQDRAGLGGSGASALRLP